ncbi:electron transfer flavoprotein subunit beta/FixA family protein [Dryocola clanedunensis]
MKILVGICEAAEWDELRSVATLRKGKLDEFCAVALEQALRIKEQESDVEIVVFCAGPAPEEILRHALALGADRVIGWDTPEVTAWGVACQLEDIARKEKVDIVLLGKQTSDWQGGIVTGMVAEKLGWQQAEPVSEIQHDNGVLHVMCYERNHQLRLSLRLPVVLAVELSLATPRYAALPAILRARRQSLTMLAVHTPAQAGESETVQLFTQAVQRKATQLNSVEELVAILKLEGSKI